MAAAVVFAFGMRKTVPDDLRISCLHPTSEYAPRDGAWMETWRVSRAFQDVVRQRWRYDIKSGDWVLSEARPWREELHRVGTINGWGGLNLQKEAEVFLSRADALEHALERVCTPEILKLDKQRAKWVAKATAWQEEIDHLKAGGK